MKKQVTPNSPEVEAAVLGALMSEPNMIDEIAGLNADLFFTPANAQVFGVIRDIRAWLPKMAPGSMLAGHDAAWHEVRRAVDELLPTAKFNSSIWCYMVPAL